MSIVDSTDKQLVHALPSTLFAYMCYSCYLNAHCIGIHFSFLSLLSSMNAVIRLYTCVVCLSSIDSIPAPVNNNNNKQNTLAKPIRVDMLGTIRTGSSFSPPELFAHWNLSSIECNWRCSVHSWVCACADSGKREFARMAIANAIQNDVKQWYEWCFPMLVRTQ